MNEGAVRFYKKLKLKNFKPQNICEVGVYLPQDSNIFHFINEGIETTLIEADPIYAQNSRDYFSDKTNLNIIEAAIFDYSGKVELCKHKSSTFVSQLKSSPALINDNYEVDCGEKFIANSMVFSEIDKGVFDLISIDIEGAEWYVIKHMISRPKVISIETHGKYYTNPNINDILKWMKTNDYILWYKDLSDSVYIKKGIFNISLLEKLQLFGRSIWINTLKKKRLLKKMIKY